MISSIFFFSPSHQKSQWKCEFAVLLVLQYIFTTLAYLHWHLTSILLIRFIISCYKLPNLHKIIYTHPPIRCDSALPVCKQPNNQLWLLHGKYVPYYHQHVRQVLLVDISFSGELGSWEDCTSKESVHERTDVIC